MAFPCKPIDNAGYQGYSNNALSDNGNNRKNYYDLALMGEFVVPKSDRVALTARRVLHSVGRKCNTRSLFYCTLRASGNNFNGGSIMSNAISAYSRINEAVIIPFPNACQGDKASNFNQRLREIISRDITDEEASERLFCALLPLREKIINYGRIS